MCIKNLKSGYMPSLFPLSVNCVMWAKYICLYPILTWILQEKSIRIFKHMG